MKVIASKNGKKKIKISKSEWKDIGQKNGWMGKTAQDAQDREIEQIGPETYVIKNKDRIKNLRGIANFMIENCPRDSKLMNTLWGYGQQLLIIADELEDSLKLTEFRSIENPKGWD